MKTFNITAAQGDLYIKKIDEKDLPDGLAPIDPENNMVVVAHSETGHHHYFSAGTVQLLRGPNEFTNFLRISEPSDLIHAKSFDTHETIRFPPGVYRINRGREYTPQGWRRVED